MSPNARSKQLLESEGYTVEIVQQRLTRYLTRDLFNCLDLVAVKAGETLGVQATSDNGGNHAARRRKVNESPVLPVLLSAGWRVEIHSWRKAKGRWKCRRETARPDGEGGMDAPADAAGNVVVGSASPTPELSGGGLAVAAVATLHGERIVDAEESLAR